MTSHVLGISALYHDSAAALVSDGRVVAAAQEERFTRKKHDPRFPRNAINYCLQQAFIEASELSAIVFYDNPILTAERLLRTLAAVAPRGGDILREALPSTFGRKMSVTNTVRRLLGVDVPVLYCKHHLSHAASAFYPSPFQSAAILTMDGVGEWATTSIGIGRDATVELLEEVRFPHSIGLVYSAFTTFCGFKVNSGEYKLMGLAPYGTPRYADVILDQVVKIQEDGSYRLDMRFFDYLESGRMFSTAFCDLFGGAAREPESRITRREMDLAASIQLVTEKVVLGLAKRAKTRTACNNLVLAGGVALNCVANGVLERAKIFESIWIQPAAGDAGGALGAALYAAHMKFGASRHPLVGKRDDQKGSYLGPAFSSDEVRAFLNAKGLPFTRVESVTERSDIVARALAAGKVVGVAAGRMEFGPRSLGARSILGDPRNADTQVLMNLKIKYRESFRPFAPSVLAERAGDYFDLDCESPYMLLVAPVVASRRLTPDTALFESGDDDLLQVVKQARSDVPAITHVDFSARLQTVNTEDAPDYRAILEAFDRLTGCPVVVNTSFNVRGEPIVCSPEDAYRCFMRTSMDMLVLEDCVLLREDQPAQPDDENWRKEYELD